MKLREAYCLFCERDGHLTTECHSTHGLNNWRSRELARLARLARAALAEPVADEPVAWLYVEDPWGANEHHFMTDSPESQNCDPRDWTPLYTRPAAAPAERGGIPASA